MSKDRKKARDIFLKVRLWYFFLEGGYGYVPGNNYRLINT